MRSITALAFATLAAAACSGSSTAPSGAYGGNNPPPAGNATHNPVTATTGFAFTPGQITISQGDSVTFVFQSVAHTVKFQNGSDEAATYYGGATSSPGAPGDIGAMQNQQVARVFPSKGTFHYRCTIHPSMTGEVIVQ